MDARHFEKYDVFCDESATSDRFTVIGSIHCHHSVTAKFERWINKIVSDHGNTSELKWTKVKSHNVNMYKAVYDAAFKAINTRYATFRCIVIDNSLMNHKLYNEGDKEIGFNKMLFQHIYSCIRSYRNRPRFYVYLDNRTTKHTPEKLREMINAKAARDLHITHNPVRVCEFRKSELSPLIQVADIICGAISYKTNRKDLVSNAAKHKTEMVDYVAGLAGVHSLATPTGGPNDPFNIWHFDLRKYAKGVPRA